GGGAGGTIAVWAAGGVGRPELVAPAGGWPILGKLIRPEDFPPPGSRSPSPRRREKFEPVPEPYLNRRASRTHRSMIPPSLTRSSAIDWMKQACGCGCS